MGESTGVALCGDGDGDSMGEAVVSPPNLGRGSGVGVGISFAIASTVTCGFGISSPVSIGADETRTLVTQAAAINSMIVAKAFIVSLGNEDAAV